MCAATASKIEVTVPEGVKLPIFMDNHSTTAVDLRVVHAMLPFFTQHYGNAASRNHVFGWTAEAAVEAARGQIAALIGGDAKEIVITSGATEANNLAIKGAASFYKKQGNHIITVETEHKSVCFDLYRRAGGGSARRVLLFMMVTINFSRLFWRLYLHLLRRDDHLSAWRIARLLFRSGGIAWPMLGASVRYLNPWFHPWQHDNRATMRAWLDAHAAQLRPVRD